MRAVDIIIKKRDRGELTAAEIDFFIQGYTRGEIPDYQASAFLMAVFLNGMTVRETTDLTMSMARSGEILDLSSVVSIAVDKHSTGGVGDKTTLVVEPLVAACGLPVGKMSGRGLGFSGGTVDKMESIPGYRTNLTTAQFLAQLGDIGLVLTGQTADLAPADGKLYALRDVAGSVESIPLLASSIMSKKIAAGAPAIVLDVKVGSGAFLKIEADARELAQLMVSIAKLAGRRAVALLSGMHQPLGYAVGNALELKEALATLRDGGPEDFREHCFAVAGHMLALGGIAADAEQGAQMARNALSDGSGMDHFRALVAAQGGDLDYVEHPDRLPSARLIETVNSPRSGYLARVDAGIVGKTAVLLGAGRAKKGDPIDHGVGILIHHKVGDQVEQGDLLFTIHANDRMVVDEAREHLLAGHAWSDDPVEPLPLFYGEVHY